MDKKLKAEKNKARYTRQRVKREKRWIKAKQRYEERSDRKKYPVNYSGEKIRRWNSLDNTAHIFPVVAGEGMANVFRFSFVLREPVSSIALTKAVRQVLPYFSTFHSRLRRGFFWYYFEENQKIFPRVQEEKDVPCRYFEPGSNNDYLFRVHYYENKINFEIYHALADGAGAAEFTREVIYHYLRIMHPELQQAGEGIDPATSLNTEDAYMKYYREAERRGYNKTPAWLLKGERLPYHMTGLVHGKMPLEQVKAAAHGYGASINEYLVAAFIYSIYTESMHRQPEKDPIAIAVPVNLRPYYHSDTIRNFFVMVSARFKADREDHSFQDVVDAVQESLKDQITKEHLESIFSYAVSREKSPLLRGMPHLIKQPVMRFVYQGASRNTTATLSNIGVFKVREEYAPYIEDFYAFLSRSYGQELKAVTSTYNGILTLTFSSTLADPSIQRAFFRQMEKDGIRVSLETNGASNLEEEMKPKTSGYPDLLLRERIMVRITRIAALSGLLLEALLLLLNLTLTPNILWSVITGASIFYVFLVLYTSSKSYLSMRSRMLFLSLGVILIGFAVDFVTGFRGWALSVALPIQVLFMEAVLLVLYLVQRKEFQQFLWMNVLNLLMCGLVLIGFLLGYRIFFGLMIAAFTATVLEILFIVIREGRRTPAELRRRFHA